MPVMRGVRWALCLSFLLCACAPDADDSGAESFVEPVLVADAADLLTLPSRIEGDLVLRGPGLAGNLALPNVEVVAGDLRIEDTDDLTSVELQGLRQVGGELSLSANRSLVSVTASGLASCGALAVSNNLELAQLAFPALASAGGLRVRDNLSLERIEAPVLNASLDEPLPFASYPLFEISRNPALTELSMPRLSELGRVWVADNLLLRELSLPGLTRAAGVTIVGELLSALHLPELRELTGEAGAESFIYAPRLTLLSLPKLARAAGLEVEAARLRAVQLPALSQVAGMRIHTPVLDELSAESLRELRGELDREVTLPRAQRYVLPVLRNGCERLRIEGGLPDCALPAVVPACAPSALTDAPLLEGCVCEDGGDPTLASCRASSLAVR